MGQKWGKLLHISKKSSTFAANFDIDPTDMEKVTLKLRTTKSAGTIRLRFRLKDGRKCDLTHPSDIVADLRDLAKLDSTGEPAKHVSKYDQELVADIREERRIISAAYAAMRADGAPMTGEALHTYIERIKHPNAQTGQPRTLLERFQKYIADSERDGVIGAARSRHYSVVARILRRFLVVYGCLDMTPEQVSGQTLMDLRNFVLNEYQYVADWPQLYADCKTIDIPTARRAENTAATKFKMLRTFFTALEDAGEIEKSPFRRLGGEHRRKVLREKYDAPIYLLADELQRVIAADIPAELEDTRKAFVVQCAFGCRLGDFARLSMDNISIDPTGFAYIHYLPEKTAGAAADYSEVETPIMRYALDIIKGCGFDFPVLRNCYGHCGYNAKIKDLLKACGIERKVTKYNVETGTNEYRPLYEFGSSKLARKTNVDIMHKVQLNEYAAGLHSESSDAVKHYTKLERADRFALMCIAFRQPAYKVDANLQLIEGAQ